MKTADPWKKFLEDIQIPRPLPDRCASRVRYCAYGREAVEEYVALHEAKGWELVAILVMEDWPDMGGWWMAVMDIWDEGQVNP